MRVSYSICPELNIAFLICRGSLTYKDFLDANQRVSQDARHKRGMIRIFDLFFTEDHFELEDIRAILQEVEELTSRGAEPDRTILLSSSTGIHLLVGSMKMMSNAVHSVFDACYSLEDAITLLKLPDREEIKKFYGESKSAET
jgi:hypothetical protein